MNNQTVTSVRQKDLAQAEKYYWKIRKQREKMERVLLRMDETEQEYVEYLLSLSFIAYLKNAGKLSKHKEPPLEEIDAISAKLHEALRDWADVQDRHHMFQRASTFDRRLNRVAAYIVKHDCRIDDHDRMPVQEILEKAFETFPLYGDEKQEAEVSELMKSIHNLEPTRSCAL